MDTEPIQGAEMPGEQAQDFAALERMAGEAAPPGEAGAEAAEPARAPLDAEISGLLQMLSKVVAPILPTVAEIYTAETCATIGAAIAPVCIKHRSMQDGIGGRYGEEILAAAVVLPIAWATVEAARGDLAARKPAAPKPGALAGADIERPAAPGAADPAGKVVQIGAVVAA